MNLLADEHMPLSFLTERPSDGLECLERMGYPFEPKSSARCADRRDNSRSARCRAAKAKS